MTADHALDHQAAGHRAELGAAEHVADFGGADDFLADLHPEQAGCDLLHLIDHIVDDREVTQIQTIGIDHPARRCIRAHIEADDSGAGCRRQRRVGFGDAAHAGGDHVDRDHVVGQRAQRLAQRLGRTLHIGLDDQRQHLFCAALPHLRHHFFHAIAGMLEQSRFAALGIALLRDILGQTFVFDHHEIVARIRHPGQPEQHHRDRRAGGFDLLPGFVEQRAHAAVLHAAHHVVAFLQRAVLHQQGRDRAAALVQGRLDHHAGATACGCGGQFHHFGLQQHRIQQRVHART